MDGVDGVSGVPGWERGVAIVAQAAPLAGVPVWFWQWTVHANEYTGLFIMFVPGLFMLGTGLVAAIAGKLAATRGTAYVREQTSNALKFQAIAAGVAIVLAGVLFVMLALATQGWTNGGEPPFLESSLQIAIFAYGVVLTLVELGRSIYGLSLARR